MATYSSRIVTSARHEWTVPAAEPFGAAAAEIAKAWTAADRAYREVHGLPLEGALPDNAISFQPGDDEIVLSFTSEQTAGRRVLTPNEHDRAWHAIEGRVGEEGADPDTVLAAVLHALGIDPPTVADEQAASPRLRGSQPTP
ncbi:hypothetical protein ACFTXJ_14605 [Streptomyces zhihengii]|uniref:hypothetical protein n=1 Tax=Streptomyces zhihengii TaxID=1818004 RepID=UPI00364479B3